MFNKDPKVAQEARAHVKGVIQEVVNETVEERLQQIYERLEVLEKKCQ